MDAQAVALVAVVAVAPLAIVLLFAILRGYTMKIDFTRKTPKPRPPDDDDE